MDSQKAYPDDGLPVWVQNERQGDMPKEWECNGPSGGNLIKRTDAQDRTLYTDSAFASDCNSSSSSNSSSPTSSLCSHFDEGRTTSYSIQTTRDDERFPPEKWKTLVSVLFYFCSLISNLTVLAIIHDRVPRGPPLPDMFFDIIPRIEEAQVVSETIIIASVPVTLFILSLHKHRFIVIRRLFLIFGILYFMRCITMFVTQLPVSKETRYCDPKENFTSVAVIAKRVTHMLGGFGMTMNGKHICCGDYVYSGHTVTLTLGYLFISEYTPSRWYLLHRIFWLTSSTGVICLVVAQGHYTIDVLLAHYATTRVFWIYHSMTYNQILKKAGRNNILSRVWWFFLFRFSEQNLGGVVPLEQEWPLPLIRRWGRRVRSS